MAEKEMPEKESGIRKILNLLVFQIPREKQAVRDTTTPIPFKIVAYNALHHVLENRTCDYKYCLLNKIHGNFSFAEILFKNNSAP